ncbi:polyprenyl synthetase family protein [Nocardia yamanashiensis]|uniref:polyprenyl synthetase family protein n=1 Tax=Nocardia yamanashiensis TaxID=209247 RepID=UPI001E28D9EF|nr:polyprenyl synthetase family protein [Nocardia yamanashiensis]UGT44895.1 polyprenyl synthetase family protein [Nocardia yamanashiensis]
MSVTTAIDSPTTPAVVRERVDAALHEFLDRKAESAAARRLPRDLVDTVRSFLFAAGARRHALFCVLGWQAGGGAGLPERVVRGAAAVELLQAATRIQDDMLQGVGIRNGRPTVHHTVADRCRGTRGWTPPERLGARAAVIIGDCGLAWAQELLHSAGAEDGGAAAVFDAMRTDFGYARYLELLTTGRPSADLEQAWEIIHFRQVACGVEHPLHLGARLAGADREVLTALSDYARPVGEAFGLRAELDGVFGHPDTGSGDLRDGKHTVLLALTLRQAEPVQQDRLRGLAGNPRLDEHDSADCREIISATALSTVQELIGDRRSAAAAVLAGAPFPPSTTAALREIATAVPDFRQRLP